MKLFGYSPPTSAQFGLAVIALYVLIAIFAPWLAPYDPTVTVAGTWDPPSSSYWLGTDNIGRDILSRLIYGAQLTLSIGLATTVLSCAIGTSMGILSATGGRVLDQILSRTVDVVLAIPMLIAALIVLSVFGSSIAVLILTIGVLDSTRFFRLSRAVAMNIAVMEYVEVARLRGEKIGWIMQREILPNASAPLISEFGLRFCFNILLVASLSFLGLGVQPPLSDWGGMVHENAVAISFGLPAPLWPAAAIALLAVCVNLVADWVLSISARPGGASAEM